MRSSRVLVSAWALVLVAMGSMDCDCGGTTLNRVCDDDLGPCETDEDCSDGLPCVDGCCGGPVECNVDDDCSGGKQCCPDNTCQDTCEEICPTKECVRDEDCADVDICMECVDRCCRSFACESDADCPPEGGFERFCPEEPDPDLGCRVCEYVRCETDEDCSDPAHPLYIESCPEGLFPRCNNGICECAHPCGGECPDGQYCCLATRRCEPIPDPCAGVECEPCYQVNPEPGGTLDEEACEVVGADCSCVPLPPLQDAFAGQHSAVALGADGLPVLSGYFGQPYGDLIFGVAAAAETGAVVDWSFVDGVPPDAPCEGAPDGPREGIAEPGDDVGWDTDIVVDDAGLPRISYFDRTHGDLRYASFDGATWHVQVVDDAGVCGRFTSMILDLAGRPVIGYMTTREAMTSHLKVARAQSTDPAGAGDWDLHIIDSLAVPCVPGDCPDGQACLEETGTCEVLDDPANCDDGNGCPDGEVCVAGNCEVEAVATSLEDLPPGVGLFTNVAMYADNSPAVAYYDSTFGNLKFAWWNPGAAEFDPPVILAGEDGAGNDLGNLGADVDMFIVHPDDTVHLAYQDADLGDVYYMTFAGTQFGAATVELVDLGARDQDGNPTDEANAVGDLHWVGNYLSTIADDTGAVRVAYQDGTSLDLVYAVRGPGGWSVEILARRLHGDAFDGNYGFFTDQVLDVSGTQAIVSNFKHNLRTDPWSSGIDLILR